MIFLVSSILSLPFIYQGTGSVIAKIVWREEIKQKKIDVQRFDKQFAADKETNAQKELESCYKLQEKFEQPHKIQEYKYDTGLIPGYFLLDTGDRVYLYGVERNVILDKLEEPQKSSDAQMKNFVENNLVGKSLEVKLPDCKKNELYNSPISYTRIVNGEKPSFKVLIFTPDGELLNLKYPELIIDHNVNVNPRSYSDLIKDRLKNELIDKLQNYQNRKPFYNK